MRKIEPDEYKNRSTFIDLVNKSNAYTILLGYFNKTYEKKGEMEKKVLREVSLAMHWNSVWYLESMLLFESYMENINEKILW